MKAYNRKIKSKHTTKLKYIKTLENVNLCYRNYIKAYSLSSKRIVLENKKMTKALGNKYDFRINIINRKETKIKRINSFNSLYKKCE